MQLCYRRNNDVKPYDFSKCSLNNRLFASCAIVAPVIAVDCMCVCNTLKFNVEYK